MRLRRPTHIHHLVVLYLVGYWLRHSLVLVVASDSLKE